MRIAIWLMERGGVAAVLIGDLVEASARHRSVWLWWQASGAIAGALARDISAHPVVALRAVSLGLVLLATCQPPMEWLWRQLNLPFSLAVVHFGLEHQIALTASIVRSMLFMPTSFGIGWLVARLHRSRTPAMVLGFLMVTWCLSIPHFWAVHRFEYSDLR